MKDYMSIQIDRPYFHDKGIRETHERKYRSACSHLRKFAQERDMAFLISVNEGMEWFDEGDAIVRITTSKELNKEEQEFIATEISVFMNDRGAWEASNSKLHTISYTAFFHLSEAYGSIAVDEK